MPHLVLAGPLDWPRIASRVAPVVRRWGRAVLKTEGCWLRQDRTALLLEGVIVEHSRPLHPVALVAPRHGDTIVRLWPLVDVERTPAVQRWLALVARDLQTWGAGPLRVSNLPVELWSDLDLTNPPTE